MLFEKSTTWLLPRPHVCFTSGRHLKSNPPGRLLRGIVRRDQCRAPAAARTSNALVALQLHDQNLALI